MKDILKQYPYDFFVFGSRVTGKHHQLSDLDLCFKDHVPGDAFSQMATAFEESDLPFKVDLIDYNQCSIEFQKRIDEVAEVFQ